MITSSELAEFRRYVAPSAYRSRCDKRDELIRAIRPVMLEIGKRLGHAYFAGLITVEEVEDYARRQLDYAKSLRTRTRAGIDDVADHSGCADIPADASGSDCADAADKTA